MLSAKMEGLMATSVISAVHDDDLVEFLDNLGVRSSLDRGELKCKFCHEPINFDDLGAVFPEGGDVKLVCDKPACLAGLAEYRSELRGHEPQENEQDDAVASPLSRHGAL
jgi:hypothetical protein